MITMLCVVRDEQSYFSRKIPLNSFVSLILDLDLGAVAEEIVK